MSIEAELSSYVGAGGLGIVGTVIAVWLRKYFSSSTVAVAKDKAEVNILVTLEAQVKLLQSRLDQAEQENIKLSIDLAVIQAKLQEYETYKSKAETLAAKIEEKDRKYELYLKESTELISNLKSRLAEKDLKISLQESENKALAGRVEHLERIFSSYLPKSQLGEIK